MVTADRGYGQATVEHDLHDLHDLGVQAVAILRQATTSPARKTLEHGRAGFTSSATASSSADATNRHHRKRDRAISGTHRRAAQAKLISEGKFDEVMKMDIDKIREIHGAKYNAAIKQMVDDMPNNKGL